MRTLIKLAIAGVAVVVCGWFAVGVRQAHQLNVAAKLLNDVSRERVPAVLRREQAALNASAFLNPAIDVTVLRAKLAENALNYARAARLIHQATTTEPDNLAVWYAYLKLRVLDRRFGRTPVLLERLHELDPLEVP